MKDNINNTNAAQGPTGLPYHIGMKVIKPLLQRYWRFKRGATLGAQGVIFDDQGRILLIRHTYRPGWHFPGGGVEFNEHIEAALIREVYEETGVIVKSTPLLHGIFANFRDFRGDHIAVYIIREWEQPAIPSPNAEIAEQGFFKVNTLPDLTSEGVKNRLTEILHTGKATSNWI